MLRLSWSARPQRIEVCRTLSPDELARRAEHMRQRVHCEGRFASYLLRVEVDDRVLDTAVVRGAGLRNDRPIYLLRDFPLTPGERRVRIRFARREGVDTGSAPAVSTANADTGSGTFVGRAQREVAEHDRRARAAIPPLLVLDTIVTVTPGRTWLVTMDRDRRALVLIDSH